MLSTVNKLSINWKMFFYSAVSLLAAFSLSWLLLMKVDFLYGLWHDYGGIQEGIEKYGPQNRFKRGFAETTRLQRLELFNQINTAVHQQGKGLADIRYESPASLGEQQLLREPEVVHLQDVANLIEVLKPIPLVSIPLWIAMILLWWRKKWPIPSIKKQAVTLSGLVIVLLIGLLLLGPEKVFNTLHIWIFPEGHQWFFYYQESLMSTMMLAPVLFGWIAGALVVVALIFYMMLNGLLTGGIKLLNQHVLREGKE
ncbi:hypothetical protein TDB9533_00280 [Thalassocella blandensis]|nr:hypothetical protein TDB9533_00280 [Thalassocella blandensis]